MILKKKVERVRLIEVRLNIYIALVFEERFLVCTLTIHSHIRDGWLVICILFHFYYRFLLDQMPLLYDLNYNGLLSFCSLFVIIEKITMLWKWRSDKSCQLFWGKLHEQLSLLIWYVSFISFVPFNIFFW